MKRLLFTILLAGLLGAACVNAMPSKNARHKKARKTAVTQPANAFPIKVNDIVAINGAYKTIDEIMAKYGFESIGHEEKMVESDYEDDDSTFRLFKNTYNLKVDDARFMTVEYVYSPDWGESSATITTDATTWNQLKAEAAKKKRMTFSSNSYLIDNGYEGIYFTFTKRGIIEITSDNCIGW